MAKVAKWAKWHFAHLLEHHKGALCMGPNAHHTNGGAIQTVLGAMGGVGPWHMAGATPASQEYATLQPLWG